jgi:hypothetical protein
VDWFRELTGLPNDRPETVRAGVVIQGDTLLFPESGRRLQAGKLATPMLADLPAPPVGPRRIKVSEVVANVTALHADPSNAGALFQVASQFNLLEMISPEITPDQGISRYSLDRTQGPACALACAAGTIYRNYLVPVLGRVGQSADRQLDMLADMGHALGNDGGAFWRMQNGYALPQRGGLAAVAARIALADRKVLTGRLRVGVQEATEVTLPGKGHLVHQVYASALPIAYANEPVADWEPFASLVLDAAYESTMAAALACGARRVFLTRLGGGAFGNPPEWITRAIASAVNLYQAADLEVCLVSHGRADPQNLSLLG